MSNFKHATIYSIKNITKQIYNNALFRYTDRFSIQQKTYKHSQKYSQINKQINRRIDEWIDRQIERQID